MTMVEDTIHTLTQLTEDSTVPKNVKAKVARIIEILKESDEENIRINKALHELEDVADDTNIQAYTRTQLWNIFSMLEKA